jgi:hypothetical protein
MDGFITWPRPMITFTSVIRMSQHDLEPYRAGMYRHCLYQLSQDTHLFRDFGVAKSQSCGTPLCECMSWRQTENTH